MSILKIMLSGRKPDEFVITAGGTQKYHCFLVAADWHTATIAEVSAELQ
jgi:hypothetical protein